MANLSPVFNNDQAVVDANGDPRSGAHLHTYLAGTSTPVAVYTSSFGVVGGSHVNPIILNANGLPPAAIWLNDGTAYKFVLAPSTDTTPPIAAILTIDDVRGVNDVLDLIEGLATEWIPSAAPTYVSPTSFTVAGDLTTALNVNRRISIVSNGTPAVGTIVKSTFTSLTTVTVLMDSVALASPLTSLRYGIVNAANTSLPFLSRDQQCGRLIYVSATQIRLDPHDGNTIWVNTSAAGWTRRTIPSGGVTAANTNTYIDGVSGQTLSTVGATYYVYLFDNAGVLTLDFSFTAPAVDATTGLKIKTGVTTRLLVGMVRVQSGSSQFGTPALVLSWYKRRGIVTSGALTTNRTQNSTSAIEVHAEIQAKFVSWAEEAVRAQFTGCALNTGVAGTSHSTRITLDGVVTAVSSAAQVNVPVTNYVDNVSIGAYTTVTEGYHYMTIAVLVSANDGTWTSGSTLYVTVQG